MLHRTMMKSNPYKVKHSVQRSPKQHPMNAYPKDCWRKKMKTSSNHHQFKHSVQHSVQQSPQQHPLKTYPTDCWKKKKTSSNHHQAHHSFQQSVLHSPLHSKNSITLASNRRLLWPKMCWDTFRT